MLRKRRRSSRHNSPDNFIPASRIHTKHKSSVSYPTFTPQLPHQNDLIVFEGVTWEMQSTRPITRPVSAGSASSFDSRPKSPLSASSSIDEISSIASDISSISNSSSIKSMLRSSYHGPTRSQADPNPNYGRYSFEPRPLVQIQPTILENQSSSQEPTPWTKILSRQRADGFLKLPEEILLVILRELKESHLKAGSLSCATCWMRDLQSLGLSNKKWWSAVRVTLYEDIQLVGSDSTLHTKKKYKLKFGSRLKLLRRTLRSQPELAKYVKSLKVPSLPESAKTKSEQSEYWDLVASVIMACPNLERLSGIYKPYDHEFTRFFHALGTRSKLVEKVWIIEPSPIRRLYNASEEAETPVIVPGALRPEQHLDFLGLHSSWSHLQTLVLHCNPGGMIDSSLFTEIFQRLPSLQDVYISNFPRTSFNDENLISLPALKNLRLDSLPGITTNGLSTYASLPSSTSLTSLSLISLPLRSLAILARLLARLKNLKSFSLSQRPSPMHEQDNIFLHPYLASSTLEHLHWEITNPDDDKASEILAKSIQFSGFPSLRSIRAPTDSHGLLQKLCKPRLKVELPGDKYRHMGHHKTPNRASSLPAGIPAMPPSNRQSMFSRQSERRDSVMTGKYSNSSSASLPYESTIDGSSGHEMASLSSARQAAQLRIDNATIPQFDVIVWDEEGQFVERFKLGTFIGTVGSRVIYDLKPDVEGSDILPASLQPKRLMSLPPKIKSKQPRSSRSTTHPHIYLPSQEIEMDATRAARSRGLSGRQIIAILMMLAAQLVLTVVVLQAMLQGRCGGVAMGFADVVAAIQVPFRGEPCAPTVKVADHVVVKNGLKKGEGVEGAHMEKDFEASMLLDGKVDASHYLLSVKQAIAHRIAGHQTFVMDKEYSLVTVLWGVIEGVNALEELAEVASSASSSTDSTTGGEDSGASREEVKMLGFRKEVEERMNKGDFEGVLKMVKSGLNKAGGKIGKGKFRVEEGSESADENMKIVEESKNKVKHGLLAAWEILQEMEEEMKDVEGWLRGMEGVLGEAVVESLEGL
ncbi:hypothetical protein DSL72_003465 [Monilinia vaccinii-corymbosi]|uniref:F-box domain-containing protein n=1 Tax=Monilinia vaccinii-corymbosi TaxID=61207 RepID=A0A8A3P5Y0_9HELO|nr:hypothetical protein DSL72_003465 [Monilinia vaccinii-corymbosi]